METITVPKATGLERLARADARIAALRAELKEWQAEYDAALEAVLPTATFAPDRVKKNAESHREGNWKLLRTEKTVRTVDAAKFIGTFPDLAKQICTIPVTKAEALVGKKNLEAFCEHKTTYSYRVADMRTPGGEI